MKLQTSTNVGETFNFFQPGEVHGIVSASATGAKCLEVQAWRPKLGWVLRRGQRLLSHSFSFVLCLFSVHAVVLMGPNRVRPHTLWLLLELTTALLERMFTTGFGSSPSRSPSTDGRIATQHNTTQHNATQHNTTQHSGLGAALLCH